MPPRLPIQKSITLHVKNIIMKQKIFSFITVVFFLLAAAISCRKVPVEIIKLDPVSLTIFVGETATLTPIFFPDNATNTKVGWESSNPTVVTVDNGKVTGIAIGRAKITVKAEDGGRTAVCWVTVIDPIEPEEMIWVEGGTFMMGCTDEQGEDCFFNEYPAHEVTLSGFYISKYTVTQKEWVAAMGINPSFSEFTGDDIPVHNISWNEIQQYIARLNEKTGKNYRLPTEAEWEYAARGGNKSKGYKYSGSDFPNTVAWYNSNTDRLHPVGEKYPNELGIYDMSGNIFEYCNDRYGYYTDSAQTNPAGPATGIRVSRGGAWYTFDFLSRNSCRYPGSATPDIPWVVGFRLVHP
jgi:formylglycine-generating enzyme required for sulfatase activity